MRKQGDESRKKRRSQAAVASLAGATSDMLRPRPHHGRDEVVSAPAASIITPLLDQPDAWLAQCVRSALAQTVHCEVIVVHSPRTGRSNLQTLATLSRRHPNLVVVEEPPGAG